LKLEKNEILQRFSALSPRERLLSVGTLVGTVFYGLYLLIYEPLSAEKILLAQKIYAQQQTYQQLKKINAEVQTLRKDNPHSIDSNDAQSIMAVIDASGKQLEIFHATKRMIPDGANKITLWLENIAFDKLTLWLAVLESKHAIRVDQVSIVREQTKSGVVNVKLLLAN
jgi:general secretion pathway protein M